MSDQAQHTMQFVINNDTSEARTYTLFDVPEAISGETGGGGASETFSIENLNAPFPSGVPGGTDIGQTWLQTESGTVKKVSLYHAPTSNGTAILEIYNKDTSSLMETYSGIILVSSGSPKVQAIDVDFNVVAGVNYYLKLTPSVQISSQLAISNPYSGGYVIKNGANQLTWDLWFKVEFETTIIEPPLSDDISTTGTLDYNSLVRSLQGEPISIHAISVIAPTSEQLENNFEFHNVSIEGHIKNYKVSVQNHKSPLDVTPTVKMRLAIPVVFGSNQNESIEYTVDANTEVSLVFNFTFVPKIQDAIDVEHEVITEDEPIKVKKQEIINKEQPKTETITLEQEDRRIHIFLIGLIIAITLTNTILWIRE